MKKTFINLHHSAIRALDDTEKQFDTINKSHEARFHFKSSLGFYGGYHYLIERDGEILQYRADSEQGAHNDQQDMNDKAIGICFAGNMSEQELSNSQIQAAVEFIKKKQAEYLIPDSNITIHRKYKATQCPGMKLPDNLWEFLQKREQKIGGNKALVIEVISLLQVIWRLGSPEVKEFAHRGAEILRSLSL